MRINVLGVCSNCQYQEEVGVNITKELEHRIEYVVLKHCDYCITTEDLTEYDGNTQLKIRKRSRRLSLLSDCVDNKKRDN